jgi:hypothetical protein
MGSDTYGIRTLCSTKCKTFLDQLLVSQDEHCSREFVSYGLNKIILNNLEALQWQFLKAISTLYVMTIFEWHCCHYPFIKGKVLMCILLQTLALLWWYCTLLS